MLIDDNVTVFPVKDYKKVHLRKESTHSKFKTAKTPQTSHLLY